MVRVGTTIWLEYIIPDFKFKGVGWYKDGKLLVTHYGEAIYMARFFDSDPRPRMKMELELPDKK